MDMTVARWFGGLAAACALAAVLLLPFPPSGDVNWMATQPPQLAAAVDRAAAASGQLRRAVRRYRTSDALARWRAAGARGDSARVRVDASVPAALAAAVRGVANEHWQRLGATASASHAEVFVYFDTSSIARPDQRVAARRRPLEPHLPFDLWHALPEATDGSRCVALVRLRSTSMDAVARLRDAPLLGPCGFFAAFGLPGAGVRTWLSTTRYGAARWSDWDVPRPPAVDASARYYISAAAAQCLTGDRAGCAAGLGLTTERGRPTRDGTATASEGGSAPFDFVLDASASGGSPVLGGEQGRLFADAVRELGHDRFSRFWSSPAEPAAAFAAATGEPLASWVGTWVARTYGGLEGRPAVRARDVLWLAVGMPLMIVAAARRRERVLGERLFGFGRAR